MGITSLSQANAVTPPGLVLITTSSFSAASTVSIDGCFTSTYDNYRIIVDHVGSTTLKQVLFRLRASASDTATNYFWGAVGFTSGNVAANTYSVATTSFFSGGCSTNGRTFEAIDVISPNVASVATNFHSQYDYWDGTTLTYRSAGGIQSATTQFDGFSILPESGTITGSLAVYGYRKAV